MSQVLDAILNRVELRDEAVVLLADYISGDSCSCEPGSEKCLFCRGSEVLADLNTLEQGGSNGK